MTVDEAIKVPAGMILEGAAAGVSAATGARATNDLTGETVFSQPLTIENGAVIDGVALTAKPILNDIDEVGIKNSKLLNIDVSSATGHDKQAVICPEKEQWNKPMRLNIVGNYFGDNNGVYNTFELNALIADGSKISDNYFAAAAGSHNIINVYAMDDYSTLDIENNVFEKSASAARIGTKGDVTGAVINFKNNTYNTTDVPEWAGLITFQPYGKETVSMGDLRVNVDNTVNNTDQSQLYVYYENNETSHLDDANKPQLYINGVEEDWASHPNGNIII